MYGGIVVVKKLFISLVLIWCLIFGGYYAFTKYYNDVLAHPLNLKDGSVEFEIKSGDTLYNIISRLNSEGKIKNQYIVKKYIREKKISLKLKPGTVQLEKEMSMEEFFKGLEDVKAITDKNSIKVTIPEGYTIEDIANLINDKGIADKAAFLKAVKEYPLPNYVKQSKDKKYNLEGFLFPDTYIVKKDEDIKNVINIFIDNFEKTIDSLRVSTGKEIKDEEIENIIIKASMIEKEARIDEDRPKIASVINNRLSKKMQLQIDATVLYAMGEFKAAISQKDLKTESPFNTYVVNALPAGAISNPGKKSIEAVLKPAETDYIYYILTKDNKTHYFTKDYNDFLNKKKELKN
jgi:UPF0755 protein